MYVIFLNVYIQIYRNTTHKMSFFSKSTYMRVSYVEQVSRASTTGTQETTGPLHFENFVTARGAKSMIFSECVFSPF